MLDVDKIKKDFPIFKINPDLVYLDSAATSLKPKAVLEKILAYYQEYSANVFRGLYFLSEKATEEYEKTREKIAGFINAYSSAEIIYVRNTTEAINLVAYSLGKTYIGKKDEIVTTIMEHHSNLVPWQQIALEKQAVLKVAEIDGQGFLKTDQLLGNINRRTRLVALTQVSNVLGTINPVKEIVGGIKRINPNCLVLVDGAQAVAHFDIDVQDLGCDFYCFSAHKMLGPTGVGILWGKAEVLEKMAPFNYGGEMIEKVSLEKTDFKQIPYKFEAGTPHIAGVVGLGAAIEYLKFLGVNKIREHEKELTCYALNRLSQFKNLIVYGPNDPQKRGGLIAFNIRGVHSHDVAQILNRERICIRSGHHCTMPLHQFLKLVATSRASFYFYNTKKDIDKLIEGLEKVNFIFGIN